MSWLSKTVSSVKSVAKGVTGGVSSAVKTVAKGVSSGVKNAVKFVDKNAKPILSVAGGVGGALIGTALLPGVGTAIGTSLGGSLGGNAKSIAKGNLSSLGGAVVGAAVSGVTAGVASGAAGKVLSKVLPSAAISKVATVATSKVGTAALAVSSSKVGSTLLSVKPTVMTAKSAVSNVIQNNPVTKQVVSLGTGKIAQMTQKAVETGKVNVASVKQTLEKASIPASISNVNSLTTAIKLSAGTLLNKPVPVVSQMTKTEAKTLIPNFEKVVTAVKSSGVIDMQKIADNLKSEGIQAASNVVQGVADALNNATPQIETPEVNKKTNYIPYVVGGAGLLGLLYAILKK